MDPNDNREYPTYSGEIFFTVTVQVDDIEASDRDDLISEFKKVIVNKLEGLLMPASVVYEDDDLSVSNEPEDFMSQADRLYEQKMEK
jgi:23S rRNA-/tRNA-specific pseudouridylate synthase